MIVPLRVRAGQMQVPMTAVVWITAAVIVMMVVVAAAAAISI